MATNFYSISSPTDYMCSEVSDIKDWTRHNLPVIHSFCALWKEQLKTIVNIMNLDSSVSIASTLQAGRQKLAFTTWEGQQILLFSSVHAGDPPILLSSGYQGLLPQEVKQLGHEADHSCPSNDEVNNAWNYTSTPKVIVIWCLIKHGERFYFTFVTTYHM
jgi:hypothetical protein